MESKAITKCRICGNTDLVPVLDLGIQALSGRFPKAGEPDPPKAPLELVKCNQEKDPQACGLLQLRHSTPPAEMYQHEYGYRSGINQTMTDHLKNIVKRAQDIIKLKSGDVVLDIGSNDATLLKCYQVPGLVRVGIDPTGKQFIKYYPHDVKLVTDFFSAENYRSAIPDKKAAVVTSIAMFYDLETPMNFVADIREILSRDGLWIFEQSYMPTMLKMNSFDTVCQEHLEYYSLHQIDWMLKHQGMRIIDVDFNDINGGSFRVYASLENSSLKSIPGKIDKILAAENELGLNKERPYMEFRERVSKIKDELYRFLTAEKAKGKTIHLYGASTKGNVLLHYCGIDSRIVTAAADRNPEKWGRRTPGTNIPIISEEESRKARPDYFLVLPWHFKKEFIAREAEFLASGGKIIFPLPKIEIVAKDR